MRRCSGLADMRSVDHFPRFIGYTATWPGVIRILLWALLFLYLGGSLLPERKREVPFSENVGGLPVTPRVTLPSDPEFVDQSLPSAEKIKKRIAWISDSSSVIYRPGAKFLDFTTMKENSLLPLKTLEIIDASEPGTYGIDLYLRLSLRSLESYTLTALALENKPDVVVLTLNPFFVFNSHAFFKGDSHFARASGVWAEHTSSWPWLLTLTSPADHLWSLLARRLNVFAKAPLFAKDVAELKQGFWNSIFPELKGSGVSILPPSEENLKENAMIFWVVQRYLRGDLSKIVNEKNEAINSLWYRQLIRLSDFDANSLNRVALEKTLRLLKASGVKAIIYLAPVSDAIREDAVAWEYYQSVKAAVRDIGAAYDDDRIGVIADMPPEKLSSSLFVSNDDVHMEDEGDFDLFLAEEILKLSEYNTDKNDEKK